MADRDVDVLIVGAGAAGAACAEALREGGFDGSGFVPKGDTVVQAGDEVLVVLDPGLEADITAQFVGESADARG